MTLLIAIGALGCVLAAVHIVACFPVNASIASGLLSPLRWRWFYFLSGIAAFCCWLAYAAVARNYLLGFAQILGVLKYAFGLIQMGINKTK